MSSEKFNDSDNVGNAPRMRLAIMRKMAVPLLAICLIGSLLLAACSSGFSIEGKWKSVGSYGFGQAQPGNIVSFDGTHCNFFSPSDTYSFEKGSNGHYTLTTTSPLAGSVSFDVTVTDSDNIKVDYGGSVTELKRVK